VTIRVGTSGWSYDHWEGVLHPPGLPTCERLAVYTAEAKVASRGHRTSR